MSTHIFFEYLLCSRHYSGCLGIDDVKRDMMSTFMVAHGGRQIKKKTPITKTGVTLEYWRK